MIGGYETGRLLLTLSRAELSAEEQQRALALAQGQVDWPQLAELAALHGVVALVRRNLAALGGQAIVPAPAWQQMQQAASQIAFDGMLQLRTLAQIIAALQKAGVDPLLLKGFALADLLYGDPLLRPSSDIDLLVRREELAAACLALEPLGARFPSQQHIDFQLAYNYDLAVTLPGLPGGPPLLLELHWDLAPRGLIPLDIDRWRGRAETFKLEGLAVRRFSAEDMLLHLALHMRKHRYVGLRWLCDAAELLRRFGPQLDWDTILATARTAGLRTLLYITLLLARQMLEAPVPASILVQLKPSILRLRLLRSILAPDDLLAPLEREQAGWTRLAPLELLLLDRPAAMGRELRYQLLPPVEASHEPDAAQRSRLALSLRRLARRSAAILRR